MNEKNEIVVKIIGFNLARLRVIKRNTKLKKTSKMLDATIIDLENTLKFLNGEIELTERGIEDE